MNWIEANSKSYLLKDEFPSVLESIEAIPTSIVREKVGELWQDYEDVRDKLMKWKRRYRQTADELAAAKAEVKEFAEWCAENSYQKSIEGAWNKVGEYHDQFYTTEELYQQFKQQQ